MLCFSIVFIAVAGGSGDLLEGIQVKDIQNGLMGDGLTSVIRYLIGCLEDRIEHAPF